MSEAALDLNAEIQLGRAFSSPTLGQLAKALAVAQREMPQPKKNKTVDITTKTGRRISYKYAELPDCLESIKTLNAHGIAVTQPLDITGDVLTITTIMIHESGEYLGSTCSWPLVDTDPKSAGSLITYMRRYALSVAGIAAEEDNDAQTHSPSDEDATKRGAAKEVINILGTSYQNTAPTTPLPPKTNTPNPFAASAQAARAVTPPRAAPSTSEPREYIPRKGVRASAKQITNLLDKESKWAKFSTDEVDEYCRDRFAISDRTFLDQVQLEEVRRALKDKALVWDASIGADEIPF